jgi:hypothetical protein
VWRLLAVLYKFLGLRRCSAYSDGARPQGRKFATNFGEFDFDLKSLAIRDSATELFAQQLLDIE